MSDTFYQDAVTAGDDVVEERVALLPLARADSNLDQFMKGEGALQLGEYVFRQSPAGHRNDGLGVVGEASEVLFLSFGQFHAGLPGCGRGSVARAPRGEGGRGE